MPYLTDEQLSMSLAKASREDEKEDESDDSAGVLGASIAPLPALGGMAFAGVVGLLRSKLGDAATGEWKVPGTKWDAEGTLALGLAAVAYLGRFVKVPREYQGLCAVGALAVGGHYLGELGRQFGRTGELGWSVGAGVPPWDPTSYDPTQFSDPFADPQARGLASSGV